MERSRRERRKVDYTGQKYDELFDEAIKAYVTRTRTPLPKGGP